MRGGVTSARVVGDQHMFSIIVSVRERSFTGGGRGCDASMQHAMRRPLPGYTADRQNERRAHVLNIRV